MPTSAIDKESIYQAVFQSIERISLLYPYVVLRKDSFVAGNDDRVIKPHRLALTQEGNPVRLDLKNSHQLDTFSAEMAQRFDGIVVDAMFGSREHHGQTVSAFADGLQIVDATSGLIEDVFVQIFNQCHDPDNTIIVISDAEHNRLLLEKQLDGGAPTICVSSGKITHVLGMKVAVRSKLVRDDRGHSSCFALSHGAVAAGLSIELDSPVPVCLMGAVRIQGELIQKITTIT